nr:hypothetical protein [Methylobacterium sp. L1A1]
MLASVFGAVPLGHDEGLRNLLARRGLEEDAVGTLRFREADGEFGMILPTDRTWNQMRLRGLILEVGFESSAAGERILVVPPTEVRMQPRLANALHVFDQKKVPIRSDLDAVACWLKSHDGEAPLAACEAVLDSPRSRERIFGLVFGGYLALDLLSPITDRSMVQLGPRCRTSGRDQLGWRILRSDREAATVSSDGVGVETGSV